MKWTRKRVVSLIVHTFFAVVPLVAGTVSSFFLWKGLFNSWQLATIMITVIEALALTGFVLFISKIESPFTTLRHLLPFISIVPLGYEVFRLLEHNGYWIAGFFTAAIIILFIPLVWYCVAEIEKQFIDPVQAAQEKQEEKLQPVRIAFQSFKKQEAIIVGLAVEIVKDKGFVLDQRQERKLLTGDAETIEMKPCPKCYTLIPHMAYVQAHRKNKATGELKGCEHCN